MLKEVLFLRKNRLGTKNFEDPNRYSPDDAYTHCICNLKVNHTIRCHECNKCLNKTVSIPYMAKLLMYKSEYANTPSFETICRLEIKKQGSIEQFGHCTQHTGESWKDRETNLLQIVPTQAYCFVQNQTTVSLQSQLRSVKHLVAIGGTLMII